MRYRTLITRLLLASISLPALCEQYETNWWSLGSGKGGVTFLDGMPANLYNASRISPTCRKIQLEAKPEAQENKKRKKKKSEKPKNPDCALSYDVAFPAAALSLTTFKLADVHGAAQLTNFVLKNIGKPMSADTALLVSVSGYRYGFSAFQNEQANALVYDDVENGLGAQALKIRWSETSGLQFAKMIPLSHDIFLGLTPKWIFQKNHYFYSGLADLSKLQHVAKEMSVKSGSGLGMDLSASYGKPSEESVLTSIMIRNLGDSSLTSSPFGKKVRGKIKQTIDISTGYRLIGETPESRLDLAFDYSDLLGREDSDVLKNTHLASVLTRHSLNFLFGINSGNFTFAFRYAVQNFEFTIGQYTEELGSKIGLRPDLRIFGFLALHL